MQYFIFNLSFTDDVDEDEEEDEEETEKFAQNTQHNRRRELSKEEKIERGRRNAKNFDGAWIGEYIATKGKKEFYAGVKIKGLEYRVGDHVLIKGLSPDV